MASTDAIKRMETRAAAAEQLISILRQQIDQIRVATDARPTFEQEVEMLKKENGQLKGQIEEWKTKLVKAENAHGITQVPNKVPFPSNGPAPATVKSTEKAPPVAAAAAPSAKKEKKGGGGGQDKDEGPIDIGRLDLRVGLIRSAKKHPDADALYVEEIDVGEEKPRQVLSGLVKFVPLEEMQNRKAIILCNMKPAKMRGIMSEAMVMCASTADKVNYTAFT
jgi:aminoacyl tRNA synthase complex-interacting multifunctional protein 1